MPDETLNHTLRSTMRTLRDSARIFRCLIQFNPGITRSNSSKARADLEKARLSTH